MTITKPLGVGILGAGPVVQAIHLPTLARLSSQFRVVNVMDVDPDVAARVAARVGASSSTTDDELLADPAVEVVAICSPGRFHADQVVAAMRAGKRAVLCEKPLATSREDAERIARVSEETGVPVLVGAMHVFDPGWLAAQRHAGTEIADAHTIRSTILIPFNDRFEDWATEILHRAPLTPPEGQPDAATSAATMNAAVLGLAIHDLPLIRAALADPTVTVVSAELLAPFGYSIVLTAGETVVHLMASVHAHWQLTWELEFIGDDATTSLEFTPSYVHAGSSSATVGTRESTVTYGPFEVNGYEGEWRALHARVAGDQGASPDTATLIDDLTFSVDIADAAAALVLAQHEGARA